MSEDCGMEIRCAESIFANFKKDIEDIKLMAVRAEREMVKLERYCINKDTVHFAGGLIALQALTDMRASVQESLDRKIAFLEETKKIKSAGVASVHADRL